MKYGVCNLSVVPCRAEASDKSEIVTQLLFGELLKVYEKKQSWYRVKTQPDGYECFIDEKQFEFIEEDEFQRLKSVKPFITSDLAQVVTRLSDHQIIPIVMGSTIFELNGNQFDNEEGAIIHVGIMLENNRIIHASGKIRIDRIDHQGIYNVDTKKYSHRLRLIKSII